MLSAPVVSPQSERRSGRVRASQRTLHPPCQVRGWASGRCLEAHFLRPDCPYRNTSHPGSPAPPPTSAWIFPTYLHCPLCQGVGPLLPSLLLALMASFPPAPRPALSCLLSAHLSSHHSPSPCIPISISPRLCGSVSSLCCSHSLSPSLSLPAFSMALVQYT